LARNVLTLVLFFAVSALVVQLFFGQVGSIARLYPINASNPFYSAYTQLSQALTQAMSSLAPVFGVIVAIIVIGVIWMLVRILA